jgi:hypothetical protein
MFNTGDTLIISTVVKDNKCHDYIFLITGSFCVGTLLNIIFDHQEGGGLVYIIKSR